MPRRITWLIQDHLILLQSIGILTEQDVLDNDADLNRMIDGSDKPLIHVLIDDRQMTQMPTLKFLMNITFIRHPHVGWVISHQENPVLRMIGAMVGSAVKVRFRFVSDLHAGLDYLAKVDPTLPDAEELKRLLETAAPV